ncbi:MAG: helix-turn-helix domain-containing protein [Arenicella sp.]
MPSLPLPLFVALVLSFILLQAIVRGEATAIIRWVIFCSALQAVLTALRLHYHVDWVAYVQPITAMIIPPLCYISFRDSAIRRWNLPQELIHLWAPLSGLLAMAFAPMLLDALIPLAFVVYAVALLLALKSGSDAMPLARLDNGGIPVWGWRLLAIFLLLSALSDILIAIQFVIGSPSQGAWIISIFNSLALLAFGYLSLLRAQDRNTELDPIQSHTKEQLDSEIQAELHKNDAIVLDRLKSLMEEQELYKDPDLTLSRIARRLTLPIKAVSGAINRVEGKNVSQFVNDYRITEACRLLREDKKNITQATLESGFRTKSNFNREFQRVMNQNPTQWLNSLL